LSKRACLIGLVLAGAVSSAAQDDEHELFETRIRPVLAENCFVCHTEQALGGLRLDARDHLLEGGVSGPAIEPGEPEKSLLIRALRHESDELAMPMGGDQLSEAQISDFVRWIELGALWPESSGDIVARPSDQPTAREKSFWSFRPIVRADPPEVEDAQWATTEIDRFVRYRLREEGLEPSEPASKVTLIRRVTYDLIGLPPTLEEVDAFVADTSHDAFDKLVDRLLESPHYGERWGRRWLDVVRYGEDDTRGLAKDGSGIEKYASAYVYRDWVVQAMNDDMPYDDFVRAQIAGDLVGKEERPKMIGGLGFLGSGPWYYDIAEPLTARADERHDRVDVTTRGFLGITVGCARCHDHKFDPISTEDYYALAGVFYNTDYHEYPVAPEPEVEAFQKKKEYVDALEKALAKYLETEGEQLARLLTQQVSTYMVAAWKVTGEPDEPLLDVANEGKLDLETLQRFVDFLAKEPKHYPFLTDWQAMVAEGGTEERALELAEGLQTLLVEINDEKKKLEEKNEWIIANGSPAPDERKSVAMPNEFKSFFDQHQLELDSIDREKFNLWTDVYRRDLDGPTDYRNRKPGLLYFKGWGVERRLSPASIRHVASMRAEIEKLKEELPEQYPFVMGVKDREAEDVTDLAVHLRGSPHNLGELEPRHFPAVLCETTPSPFLHGSGRLELAEAIVSHPLTARVIVNRVWRWHFGTGLVDTASNFGRLGERPSHPALLEHLAGWFLDNDRSLKALHRKILLTETYRLGSGYAAKNFDVDPANRLYWRANRRRLDAESIRDSILFVSGGLDPKMGGASVDLSDEDNRRRTIYGRVSRFRLHDYLQTFDFPNPSLTAEKRFSTNVPLQSLYFMNSAFVDASARRLVYRLAGEEVPDEPDESWVPDAPREKMVDDAYRLLFGREPSPEEAAAGIDFVSDEASLQSWTRYGRVLLSTNEFRFVN